MPTSYAKGRRFSVACMGDSLTFAAGSGVRADQYWPEQLGIRLRAAGAAAAVRNCGKSGDTSTQMLARIADMLYFDPSPVIAIIHAGYNDPGASIPQATTQANIQAMIRYLRNGCVGQVAGQATLPAEQAEGTKYLVVSDTSSTGGINPELAGSRTGPQVWQSRNGLAGESGWGRLNSQSGTTITRFMLLTTHFCNYSSAGDTVDTGHAGQNATRKQVYDAQAAAQAAEAGAVLCDIYASLQARIVAATTGDTATNYTWHTANGDIHPNPYGHDLIAQCAYATLVAQEGWLAAIS
jgi:lysophospholipase L1-like esterase